MIAGVLYALLLAALISAIAWAAERTLAPRRVPRRGIWAVALLCSVLIPIAVLLSGIRLQSEINEPVAMTQVMTVALSAPSAPVNYAVRPEPSSTLAWPDLRCFDRPLLASLGAGSALALFGYAFLWLHLSYRARSWSGQWVDGEFVWLTEDAGPAVVGAMDPRILLPRWFIDLPPTLRRSALEHERQHIAARDPLLWQAALLLATAMPWNPILWWQLRRLRFSQELDCDARVLRSGVDAGTYAQTLLAVARRQPCTSLTAVALTDHVAELESRIWALFEDAPRRKWSIPLLTLLAVGTIGIVQLPSPRVDLQIDVGAIRQAGLFRTRSVTRDVFDRSSIETPRFTPPSDSTASEWDSHAEVVEHAQPAGSSTDGMLNSRGKLEVAWPAASFKGGRGRGVNLRPIAEVTVSGRLIRGVFDLKHPLSQIDVIPPSVRFDEVPFPREKRTKVRTTTVYGKLVNTERLNELLSGTALGYQEIRPGVYTVWYLEGSHGSSRTTTFDFIPAKAP